MKINKFYSILLLFFVFLTFNGNDLQAQSNKKVYSAFSFEMIFSFADVSRENTTVNNVMRWAPVLNMQWLLNMDPSDRFGLYTGLDIRNLGFIWQSKAVNPHIKYKHRSYMLGLPVGLKVGDLDGLFVYFGGQIEWGFHYKEKRFENDNKVSKFTEWNSKRINQWQPSAFIGINFPYGMNLKFKYYFENFLNPDFVEYDANGDPFLPYAGTKSQIFYFSLNFFMFEPVRTYTSYVQGKENTSSQRARLERRAMF